MKNFLKYIRLKIKRIFLKIFLFSFTSENEKSGLWNEGYKFLYILGRDVNKGGAGGAIAPPHFGRIEGAAGRRTVLRFDVKVAVLLKLRLKIMTFLSHMSSPMLVYAFNTI